MARFNRQRDAHALSPRAAIITIAASLAFHTGCAGHESRVRDALDALDRNQPDEAIRHLNDQMEVPSAKDLPLSLEGDNALLVLDRASIQLSLGRYTDSARDFGAADKAIELLDMRSNAADDLGKYLFSDSVGRYKAPAYEKIMIQHAQSPELSRRRQTRRCQSRGKASRDHR
jgi:uncharacterized protein